MPDAILFLIFSNISRYSLASKTDNQTTTSTESCLKRAHRVGVISQRQCFSLAEALFFSFLFLNCLVLHITKQKMSLINNK